MEISITETTGGTIVDLFDVIAPSVYAESKKIQEERESRHREDIETHLMPEMGIGS
jgi:hypothetical protein